MKSMEKNQMDYLLKAKRAQMISLPSLDRIRPIILDISWQSILTTVSACDYILLWQRSN